MKERTQRKGELNERIPYDNVIPIGRIRNLITFCCVVNVSVRDTITSAPRGTLCKRLCDSLSSRAFGTPRCSMSPSYIHVFTSRHTTGVAHGTEAHEAKGASSPIAIASFAGVPRLITPFAIFRAPTGQQALAAPDQRFAIAAAPAAAPARATPVQTPHCRTTVARPGT